MKKLAIIVAIVLAPIVTFGQSIFDKFEDLDEVTSVLSIKKCLVCWQV